MPLNLRLYLDQVAQAHAGDPLGYLWEFHVFLDLQFSRALEACDTPWSAYLTRVSEEDQRRIRRFSPPRRGKCYARPMDAALASLLDENLLAATREFARWQSGATCVD